MLNHLVIDAGGTSSRAVLVKPDGSCLGYGTAGGGNPVSRGFEPALEALVEASKAALGGVIQPFGSATLCMAGGSLDLPKQLFNERFTSLGLQGEVLIESDLLATFYSGTYQNNGYALIAGTGAVAARVENAHLAAVSDGTGWMLGDNGSGFWLGREAVRAVAAALDTRGPQTALTELLLADLEIAYDARSTMSGRSGPLQELIAKIYALPPIEMSRFAPLVFQAASLNGGADSVAQGIIDDAGTELARTLRAVMTPTPANLPLVFGGSVLTKGNTVSQAVLAKLPQGLRGPSDGDPALVNDGVAGAAVLGLKRNGVEVDQKIFETVAITLAALRN